MSESVSIVLPRSGAKASRVCTLARQFKAGNQESFYQIVRATYEYAHLLALEITGNSEDAHEVVLDAYLKVRRDIGNLKDEVYFYNWMKQIVFNCASAQLGHSNLNCVSLQDFIDSTEYLNPTPSFEMDEDYEMHEELANEFEKQLSSKATEESTYFDKDRVDLQSVINKLKEVTPKLTDDVGLIDEQSLRDYIPTSDWDVLSPDLLHRCGLKRVLGRLASKDTTKARVKAALLNIGRPATKEELALATNLDLSRIGSQLSSIPSIMRADKLKWGLAEWIEDVYEGIPAEIVQRIRESGGVTTLEQVLEEIPRLFGVSESSVRAYLSTPQFVLNDGKVRLRKPHEPYQYGNSEVRSTPGVFSHGKGRVSLFYKVDKEVLRGSGRNLTPAVGAILRLSVNDRLDFVSPIGTIVTVTFPETSSTGPKLGSTRALAEELNAKLGSFMTVTFDLNSRSIAATSTDITRYSRGWDLVARLTGVSKESGLEGLAYALNCSTGEVRATLRKRGDSIVLNALPPQQLSSDLEKALAELDAEMERSRP